LHYGRFRATLPAMLFVPGSPAFSAARLQKRLQRVRLHNPGVTDLAANFVHLVDVMTGLDAGEMQTLKRLLQYGPRGERRVLDDGDLCTFDTCNSAAGVTHTPVAVDDGNPATIDACDPHTGSIHHTACAALDPTARDHEAVALPDALVPLHRVIRPARLAGTYFARAMTLRRA